MSGGKYIPPSQRGDAVQEALPPGAYGGSRNRPGGGTRYRKPFPVGQLHKLSCSWTFWAYRPPGKGGSYAESLVEIGSFDSVQGFWAHYSYLTRLGSFTGGQGIFLFRTGVQPMWEVPANSSGGRVTVIVPRAAADVLFEIVLLSAIGGTAPAMNQIQGIVGCHKANGHRVAVWTRTQDGLAVADLTTWLASLRPPSVSGSPAGEVSFKAHGPSTRRAGAVGGETTPGGGDVGGLDTVGSDSASPVGLWQGVGLDMGGAGPSGAPVGVTRGARAARPQASAALGGDDDLMPHLPGDLLNDH
eukprot:TRINITY_DN56449_c0_g1_i1.p1 TRINITY_DN56449_c0_g1~~TRINITY_DN56449_c0_g1_i1.p1  ORF type:complete len:301 (+),score=24.55 TRINITY_DN56449_c0_g1_i1:76-978(+)